MVATCKHYAAYSLEAADGWTQQTYRQADRQTDTQTDRPQTDRPQTDRQAPDTQLFQLMDSDVQVVATCKHYAAYSLEAADSCTCQPCR